MTYMLWIITPSARMYPPLSEHVVDLHFLQFRHHLVAVRGAGVFDGVEVGHGCGVIARLDHRGVVFSSCSK